jgi:hypothetical protein
MVLLAFVMFAGSALAGSFEVSPRQYGSLANRVLRQVGANLRFRIEKCDSGAVIECRFTSGNVVVRVQGTEGPRRTGRVLIEADLLRDKPGAGPLVTVADCVLTLGATMVIFDPQLAAEPRARLLSELTTSALDTGKSEDNGVDARYSLVFDEAASGILSITVTPIGRRATDDIVGSALR